MERVHKIISLCNTENTCQFWTKIIPLKYKTWEGRMKGFPVIVFGGQLLPTNHHHPLWKVKVGFNLQIKNVFGRLKKYKL